MRTDYIGLRVARWRDIGGMTQLQLADAVGVTREYISMIENGKRPVTKRSLLISLAEALGVSTTDLTGQPYEPETPEDLAIYRIEAGVRTALDEDLDDERPADPAALAARLQRVRRARMKLDYPTLAELLPGLVTQTRLLADSSDGERARIGLRLFVAAAVEATFHIKSYGHLDLGMRCAEAARSAAAVLGEPAAMGAAAFVAAQCLRTEGARRRSLGMAVDAANQLGDGGDDAALTWYGMLHLHAALSAAALGRADDVAPHLAAAVAAAARVVDDVWAQELTPANVGIWRVGIALENGEPDRAPAYARLVDPSRIRTVNRRARLHIDTGRGFYAAGQADRAIRELLRADDLAPTNLRNRPFVRELVGQMVRDARAGGSSELRTLAARCRVDPLTSPA